MGSAYVNNRAFQLESAASSGGLFPAYDAAPDSPHWVYSGSQITPHGWMLYSGFNHLSSTQNLTVSGPKTISHQTISFNYSANWNSTTFMDQRFQPPAGANVVYYTTYGVTSSRGLGQASWSDPFNSARGPLLTGYISGSNEFWDQWRGSYDGAVTIYYSYP